MDSKVLLNRIIEKADLKAEEKDNYKRSIEKVVSADIPDEMLNVVDNFLTLEIAKNKLEVKEHYVAKINEEDTRMLSGKLLSEGYTEEEIKSIINSERDKRYDAIVKGTEAKLQKKYTANQSEKDIEYAAILKAKELEIESLKSKITSTLATMHNAKAEAEREIQMKYFLSSLPIKTGKDAIPRETAINLLLQEIKNSFDSQDANIKFVNNMPMLVKKSDETSVIIDEKNNIVDAHRFVRHIANKLNLLENSTPIITKEPPKSAVKTYSMTDNNVSTAKYTSSSIINKILKTK